MTIVGSFILYAVMGNVYSLRGYGAAFSSYYVSLSIFSWICINLSGYADDVVFSDTD